MPDWLQFVPKEPRANLKWRQWLLLEARKDPRLKKAILAACRDDILFWINAFVYQVNPKKVYQEVGPFITWDFQDKAFLETIERLLLDQDDMLWEKSREMGATWMALLIAVWLCLFHPNKRILCVSHSEHAVDKAGDDGTLFAKIKFIVQYLPDWMRRGAKQRKLAWTFEGRSSISGAASTGRSGVGDRVTMVLLDEFSKQQQAREILGQTADTGPRLFIGTHYGIGTTYYELTQRPDLRKIVMHWSQHPDKRKGAYRYNPAAKATNGIEVLDKGYHFPDNFKFVLDGMPSGGPYPGLRSVWYDKECVRRASSRDVAMHLDIDPQGSTEQFFDVLTIKNLVVQHAREPFWEGAVHYEHDTGKPISLVAVQGGPLKLWTLPQFNGLPKPGPYAFGCDLSAGTGATPSCLSGVDCNTGTKILEYSDARMDPKSFAVLVVALCWIFKNDNGEGARLAWETPGPGRTFGLRIQELGYGNIYFRPLNEALAGGGFSETPGWVNSGESKRALLEEYRSALACGQYVNRSEQALLECLNFKWTTNGQIEHSMEKACKDGSGALVNHGDHVIADALAWLVCKGTGIIGAKKREEIERPPIHSLAWRRLKRQNSTEEAWA